jgi:DNA ligase-1
MNNLKILKSLSEMIEALKQDNSTYWKQSVLWKYEECKEILKIIYDPITNLYVTGNNVLKYLDTQEEIEYEPDHETIYLLDLLNMLINDKSMRGNRALNLCGAFLLDYMEYEEVIIKILNKDLKCGISTKTINLVWPDLINEFNVPLAKDYKEDKCDFKKDRWYISRKLDGVRCLTFITDNEIKFYSRDGKEFLTLDKLKSAIIKYYIGPKDIILDGEVCIVDSQGNENFKDIIKQIRRKDYTIENPLYYVFDMYSIGDFKYLNQNLEFFEDTYCNLTKYIAPNDCLKLLKQDRVFSKEEFEFYIQAISENWEGYMLRKDYPTQFKRSNNLLKVKKFKEREFTVIETLTSTKVIDGREQKCVGSLIINYKNNLVYVGSGLNNEQRLLWYKNKDLIMEKTITVKYFSESVDKEGNYSLRFPILKHVWDEEKI